MKTLISLLIPIFLSATIMTANAAGKLHHVVSFKFKSTATPEDIKKVEEAFQTLKKKISQIESLEWGTNVSKENFDKGFTHCFILTFKNQTDRDAYIHHPEHQAFVKIGMPVIEDVFVIDFESRR